MSVTLETRKLSPEARTAARGKVKLAVVGCGAAAKILHLPAIARSERAEAAVLVDRSLERAGNLARKHGVPAVMADYRKIGDRAEAAIVALPNDLHAAAAVELLRQGMHVLVEKPMALTSHECDAMIEAAAACGKRLAVGMEMRLFAASRLVGQLLQSGWLGRVTGFDLRFGIGFDWPVESDYLFQKNRAGGGVLIDFGVHLLDLLLWWLGDYDNVDYLDDAMGGVESNCELRLELEGGARGVVELSRTRKLRNTCILHGERGALEISLWTADPDIRLTADGNRTVLTGRVSRADGAMSFEEAFWKEIDDFAGAIRNDREPLVPGREARRAIRLIEECYAARRLLSQPWCSDGVGA